MTPEYASPEQVRGAVPGERRLRAACCYTNCSLDSSRIRLSTDLEGPAYL